MHVVVINQFYAPDHSATAQLTTELCEDLVKRGNRVSVIAGRGSYLGGRIGGRRETLNGVQVVRSWSSSLGKATLPARLVDYATFLSSSFVELTLSSADVIVALTTPPLLGMTAALSTAIRKVPLVTWVQDVYPEIAVKLGVLPAPSVAVTAFRSAMRMTHRATDRVVALSAGMADRLVAQGARRDQITVIHNWADGHRIAPVPRSENRFLREHGLVDRFVVMYSGNLGVCHEFETFAEAARILQRIEPRVVFVFVGHGTRRADLERRSRDLSNVKFLEYQPRERLAESLSAADIHAISLRSGFAGLAVPSKLYGCMASARPVYFVGDPACEVSRVVKQHEIGWTSLSGAADETASRLAEAARSPHKLLELGQRARSSFQSFYDRPHAVAKWEETLLRVAGARR